MSLPTNEPDRETSNDTLLQSEEPVSIGENDSCEGLTVGDIIERLGLSRHQLVAVAVVWAIWGLSGWVGTLVPYILDAAGDPNGDWSQRNGSANVLTVHDKSIAMLGAGIAGMIGSLLLGYLSDLRGRIFATTFAVCLCCVAVTGFTFSISKLLLITFLIGTPFSRDGITGITMSLMAEWLPIYWRGLLVVSLHAMWNAGRLALTLWWVICPPSQHWFLFFSVAALMPFIVLCFLLARGGRYESPRWLAVAGHLDRSMCNLRRAAMSSPEEKLPLLGWDSVPLQVEGIAGHHVGSANRPCQYAELLAPGVARRVVLLSVYNIALMFASNGFFIWALEYFHRIEVDPRPAMIAAPLGKIASNLLLITPGPQRCPIDCMQRLPLMRIGFLGFAASLIALCLVRNIVALTAIIFICHVFEESLWTVGGLYMTEAFPTTIRNTAVGALFMVGHVGSILSASLFGEMLEMWTYLPIVTMSAGLLLGLIACFALPPGGQSTSLVDTLSE